MNFFFYNTDATAIVGEPKPRFGNLIRAGFAAVGGDRQRYGDQFSQLEKGDVLLMYENGIGVVAAGEVLHRWDRKTHRTPLYYHKEEMKDFHGGQLEYRIGVQWFSDLSQSPITIHELREYFGYIPRGAVRRIVKHRSKAEILVEKLRRENRCRST